MKVQCTTEETINPISFIPPLWTGNGFGYTLYGGDNTYVDRYSGISYSIKTCYFCVLWIPIYPIARYAVCQTGYSSWGNSRRGGSSTSYSFDGQLPWKTSNYIHYVVSVFIIGYMMFGSNPRLYNDIGHIFWSFLFSLWFQVFPRMNYICKWLMLPVGFFMIKAYYGGMRYLLSLF